MDSHKPTIFKLGVKFIPIKYYTSKLLQLTMLMGMLVSHSSDNIWKSSSHMSKSRDPMDECYFRIVRQFCITSADTLVVLFSG